MSDKRDIHKIEAAYERQRRNLRDALNINPVNRELIFQYLDDAKKGMHGGRSPVGTHKLGRYLQFLTQWETAYQHKSFVQNKEVTLSMADYRTITDLLANDTLKCENGRKYADSTKGSMFMCLNAFIRWLSEQGFKLSFIPRAKQKEKITNPETIDKELWKEITEVTKDFQEEALIMSMFDSGCRPAELLNLKIKEVIKHKDNGTGVNIYKLNIQESKTFPRIIEIPLATPYLMKWLERHPNRDNTEAYVFLMTYDSLRRVFAFACEKVINRKFEPYTARRSSITYYATKLTEAQLAYRIGQVIGSKSLRRYVNRNALESNDVVTKVWANDSISQLEKKNADLSNRLNIMETAISQLFEVAGGKKSMPGLDPEKFLNFTISIGNEVKKEVKENVTTTRANKTD